MLYHLLEKGWRSQRRQINELGGTGVQEGKTQEVGSTKSESSELGQASCLESQGEGRIRDRIWTAAPRGHLMFKGDLQGFMNIG